MSNAKLDPKVAAEMDRAMGIKPAAAQLPHKDSLGRFVMRTIRPSELRTAEKDGKLPPPKMAAATAGPKLDPRVAAEMDRQMGIRKEAAQLPHKDSLGRFVMRTIRPSDLRAAEAKKDGAR